MRSLSQRIVVASACALLIGGVTGCGSARTPSPPAYGVKIRYARGKPLTFPDLTLEFIGEREETSPSYSRGFRYYDFTARQGDQEMIVSWTGGTGDIAPIPFELGGNHYRLELVSSDALGRMEKNELVLWKDEAQP